MEKTLRAIVMSLLKDNCEKMNSTKDYVRNFQQKMQNEPNFKDRIQNTEDRIQNKKMCISICPIKDYAAIFPANCLSCYQVVISGHKETKPNEANFKAEYRTQDTVYRNA